MTSSSIMRLPVVTKAVLHASTKAAVTAKTHLLPPVTALALMSGQRPALTRAKGSIASFRLRKHQLLGCKVTLRHHRLTDFMATLIYGVVPQRRDGSLPQVHGTYVSFGLSTVMPFPQIEHHYDIFEHVGGAAVTVVTSGGAPLVCSWYGLPCKIAFLPLFSSHTERGGKKGHRHMRMSSKDFFYVKSHSPR